MYMYVGTNILQCSCESQKKTCRSQFSPATTQILVTTSRSTGLVTGAFSHSAISLACISSFKK